jgi:hypothetical protein
MMISKEMYNVHLVESDGELYMVTLFNTNTRRDA